MVLYLSQSLQPSALQGAGARICSDERAAKYSLPRSAQQFERAVAMPWMKASPFNLTSIMSRQHKWFQWTD